MLDALGTFINQGTIAANGPAGSSFTIDVQQDASGSAGVFINDNEIDVGAGNAMTIAVGDNAGFYNPGIIQIQGGSLDVTATGTAAFDGAYVPVRGLMVLSQGGTAEINVGYATTTRGESPYFAFADGQNDTLKLDQAAQFGGHILGFAVGDTIEIGPGTITGYTYSADGVLALQDGAATVASLSFVSGGFNTGSFAVGAAAAASESARWPTAMWRSPPT